MEPCSIDNLLYSFNPAKYALFMLVFYIMPYPIYRYIAHKLNWELNTKTVSRHWNNFINGFTYGLIVFMFGNYANTLNWITMTTFYPSLFAYALIAELPFTKTSLPNIRSWPKGMWTVFIMAISVILIFAAYHIYLGSLLPEPFLYYYVSALMIPIAILASSFALSKEVNSNWCTTKLLSWKSKKNVTARDVGDESNSLLQQPNTYASKISFHLHHWQIFYVLAFFTRFDNVVSQVGAGIVLACYMEGICAYGYDPLVNDD